MPSSPCESYPPYPSLHTHFCKKFNVTDLAGGGVKVMPVLRQDLVLKNVLSRKHDSN